MSVFKNKVSIYILFDFKYKILKFILKNYNFIYFSISILSEFKFYFI